jgi:hypothetical protein
MVRQKRFKRVVVWNPSGQSQFIRIADVAGCDKFRMLKVANHFNVALANAAAADHGKFG